jgi:hypothetical protein
MVILGLLLILMGALTIVAVVFDVDSIRVDLLGAEISAIGLFLLGVGSGVAILWGFAILKYGTKRTLKHRREQKELAELSEKLDRAEAQRKDEGKDEGKDDDERH